MECRIVRPHSPLPKAASAKPHLSFSASPGKKMTAFITATLWISIIGLGVSNAQRARAPRQAGSLTNQIASLIDHPDVREAHWGISVVSMKKGSVVASWNEEKLFIPASTAKLYPAAAALSLIGS